MSNICLWFKVISVKYLLKYLFTVESNFCQIFVHLKAGLSPSEVVWGIKFSRGNDFLSKFSTFSFEKMPQRVAEVVSMGSLTHFLSLNRNNIYDTHIDIGSNKFPQVSSTSLYQLPNQGHCYIFRSCYQLLSSVNRQINAKLKYNTQKV